MAITNAQQYKQLVNKPADNKRPGYRGDAAYGKSSRSAQAREIGQAKGATGKGGGASQNTRKGASSSHAANSGGRTPKGGGKRAATPKSGNKGGKGRKGGKPKGGGKSKTRK